MSPNPKPFALDQATLRGLILQHAPRVMAPAGIYRPALLHALADVESSGGMRSLPRYEAAYAPGGAYFRRHVPDIWERFGDWASCSYGAFQMLYVTAWELGYRQPPDYLAFSLVDQVDLIVKLLNGPRIFAHGDASRGAQTVGDVGDAWNSGTWRDDNDVPGYRRKIERAYRARAA